MFVLFFVFMLCAFLKLDGLCPVPVTADAYEVQPSVDGLPSIVVHLTEDDANRPADRPKIVQTRRPPDKNSTKDSADNPSSDRTRDNDRANRSDDSGKS